MLLNSFEIGVNDSRRYPVGYGNWLSDGETITDVSGETVSPTTDPVFSAVGEINADADGVIIQAGGGLVGTTYTVLFTITTDLGGASQVRQDCLEFTVVGGCD